MADRPEREVTVFNAARGLPVGKRAAYLDETCADDAPLRQRVEELLQAHEQAAGFMDRPAAPDIQRTLTLSVSLAEKVGDRIGHYKLLQQIGEGGCGVVYMAEQEQPVKRRVALKILKLGMDTKQVIARFEAERQALAVMDHPNIAKVLDAGATDTGRPYFVMELVRGIKITDYCDQNNLAIRERLDLFVQVCRAIQHAHQKGIIHRDIKPSNILVTVNDGVPVPKVIDFGIAKATQGRLTDQTLFTAFEQFIGTPAYMSPEQAVMTSLDIDTRSDIYSLGVLLYELLTGQTPFDQQELLKIGFDEMRRTIREREPQRPSTRLSTMTAEALTPMAKQRHTEAPKLIHLVRGDLDWIVMKALEKDRNRRYETANGFARDIERYLADEPVSARPPSRLYEFQKTVRRHKFGFGATAALITVLVAGVVVSTLEAIRARRAEQEQARLRQQAEAGRAAEVALRQVAESQERVARAKVFYDSAKYDQAEKLLNEIPTNGLPYPECAALLRMLGSQRAAARQWKEAAGDFSAVMRFNTADNADTVGYDFLRYGPVLIELGDTNRYQQFVRDVIARFAGTSDPVMAERVCKICLLMPADAETLRKLGTFYNVTTNRLNDFTDLDAKRWACVSLAIFEYRRGNYAKSAEWSTVTLGGRYDTYIAVAHIIRAMATQQLGHGAASRADFIQGRDAINPALKRGVIVYEIGIGSFDWMYAGILLKEANALIKDQPGAT
jgi:serine/threonine protein kinase